MPKPKKAKKKPGAEQLGPGGLVVQARRVRTGTTAISTLKVRCRPGSFEWRYGRFGNAQYHAGAAFARLWERSGIASAGGGLPSLGGSSSGKPGSLADARVAALDEVRRISDTIGGPIQRRLVAYCVEGRTPKEIAATYHHQVTDRQVSETLDLDLIELARAMGFANAAKLPVCSLAAQE